LRAIGNIYILDIDIQILVVYGGENELCHCCGASHHKWHCHHEPLMDWPYPMSIDDEIKMLEEYKEDLTKRLERVKERLEALKR